MKARFEVTNPSISENELQEFEKLFGINLPENYKRLLKKYNGSYNENDEMLLDYFCSIKYGELTLEESITDLQILENNIPREYLPFAATGTGNQITLSLKAGDDYGKIYLFRYDELKPIFLNESLEQLLGVNNIDEL
jgi:cell wall assembly regulator SMI1